MWTKKDNGVDVTWQEATTYCQNLQIGSQSDWRLPTIDELKGIFDSSTNAQIGARVGKRSLGKLRAN